MLSYILVCPLSFILLFFQGVFAANKESGFLVTDYLKDGELERRVKLRKWKAKETSSVQLENGER
jgi:hypothetical protein